MSEKNLNSENKTTVQKESKFYLSTSFYGALIFSIALWLYTNLNEEFQTTVSVPLKIELPKDKAIEKDIPEHLNIMVKGTGWNLFNLIYFNTAKQCNILLQSKDLQSDYYQISRQEIIKSVEYFQNIETREVIPDVIDIYYGTIQSKVVPIVANINVTTLDNFIFSDSMRLKPNRVEIRGNKRIIDSIDYITTEKLTLLNLTKSVNSTLKIKDTLSAIIEYNVDNIKVNIDVQQKSHLIIENIQVDNFLSSKNKILIPSTLKLIITGGVNDLTLLNIKDLKNRIQIRKIEKYDNYYEATLNISNKFKVEFYPKIIKVLEKEKFVI